MRDKIFTMALKLALFLLIVNVIMLFITDYGSAEWVITVISACHMALLTVIISVLIRIRIKKEENHEKK